MMAPLSSKNSHWDVYHNHMHTHARSHDYMYKATGEHNPGP